MSQLNQTLNNLQFQGQTTALELRVGAVEGRLAALEPRVRVVESRPVSVETRLAALETTIRDFIEEIRAAKTQRVQQE